MLFMYEISVVPLYVQLSSGGGKKRRNSSEPEVEGLARRAVRQIWIGARAEGVAL